MDYIALTSGMTPIKHMKINRAFMIGYLATAWMLTRTQVVYAQDFPDIAGASAQLNTSRSEQEEDARVKKLEKYLTSLNSPLVDNAEDFVKYADIYGYGDNWSMVAAIAGVESTFGKRVPKNSYNAWGWGIPTGKQSGIGFEAWEEGIATVSKGLKENYMDRGATNLASIGRIYAPPSHTWAGNVQYFMNEIEQTSVEPELSL
ncbi:MAG: hypothetical protein UU81_C0019G0003 [Microgenomates group bacterium GW2011_GWC1_41_8]|nr:MAG: hypothetical protein UU81_C0019G0003 [Microgenomates group bacterium GW2011_GWC1_41_8]